LLVVVVVMAMLLLTHCGIYPGALHQPPFSPLAESTTARDTFPHRFASICLRFKDATSAPPPPPLLLPLPSLLAKGVVNDEDDDDDDDNESWSGGSSRSDSKSGSMPKEASRERAARPRLTAFCG
jgi:hypothetical protein